MNTVVEKQCSRRQSNGLPEVGVLEVASSPRPGLEQVMVDRGAERRAPRLNHSIN